MSKTSPIYLEAVSSDSKFPYFFSNPHIDKNVYIVQKASNIPNALYILEVWNKDGVNVGEIERYNNPEIPHTKYLYSSANEIKIEHVNGGSDKYKVLLYKKLGKTHTTALLKYL